MLLHIATASDWAEAQASGHYTTSTRGRTLDEEGFIHCSADQAQADGVLDRYYADCAEPLLLLSIDEARVPSEVKVEGGFPHVYGPIPVDAVVAAAPIRRFW